MAEDDDYLPGLLAHMGIKAEVRRDARQNALIIIETQVFKQRRGWIETWFELVEEQEDFCTFRERIRGSEDTMTSGD